MPAIHYSNKPAIQKFWCCRSTQSRCHPASVFARQSKFNNCVRVLSNVRADEWQDYFAVIRKCRMKLSGGKNKTSAACIAALVLFARSCEKIKARANRAKDLFAARLFRVKTAVSTRHTLAPATLMLKPAKHAKLNGVAPNPSQGELFAGRELLGSFFSWCSAR